MAIDKTTKGAMFVPVCSGSDKTTMMVGTDNRSTTLFTSHQVISLT